MLVVALVTFGIAAVALTTFEVVTGQALSGGKGTTFQQVSEGTSDKGSETKKKEPTKKPTPTATAESASEQPTAEPRAQASNSQPEATTERDHRGTDPGGIECAEFDSQQQRRLASTEADDVESITPVFEPTPADRGLAERTCQLRRRTICRAVLGKPWRGQ